MPNSTLIKLFCVAALFCMPGAAAARDLSDCEGGKAVSAVAAVVQQDCADTHAASSGKTQPPLAGKAMLKPRDIVPTIENTPQAAPNTGSLIHARDFVVLVKRPQNADGETLVLLHGSGGDETTLMALAARIAPRAVLMGVRGRIVQDGKKRWYKRLTPTSFDQNDIRNEAAAFAAFLTDAIEKGTLDPDHTTFIGYSNGANLLAALTVLHPGLVERAVLLRPMSVLEAIPQAADLSSLRALMVAGTSDLVYAPLAPALEDMLRDHGANLDAHTIKANHGLGKQDVLVVSEWLNRSNAISLNQ